MSEHMSPIPSRLYNAAVGGHVSGADQIIDDKTGLTLDKVAGGALEEKEYTSGSNNGMGRVVLRKNLVGGVNTLTQTMINKSNTIYVIQYDFTLGGNITVPANCVLEFDGGSISGLHTIIGDNTIISADNVKIFGTDVSFGGYWCEHKVNVCWFGAVGDIEVDSTNAFKAANRAVWEMSSLRSQYQQYLPINEVTVFVPTGNYYIHGNSILGGIWESGHTLPTNNRTTIYNFEGNNSIIYWETESNNDTLFSLDETIAYPKISNFKLVTINDYAVNTSCLFRVGHPDSNGGSVQNGVFSKIETATGYYKNRGGEIVDKIFYVIGEGGNDTCHVVDCTLAWANYVWYNTNSQAVGWFFDKCSFNVYKEGQILFYTTAMDGGLFIKNNSFSISKGQTIFKFDSKLRTDGSGKLYASCYNDIVFSDNRVEVRDEAGYDYLNLFVGNAGRFICENISFVNQLANETNFRILLAENGSVYVRNCVIPILTATVPEFTNKIIGTNYNLCAGNFIDCNVGILYIKGYDWTNNTLVNITNLFLSPRNNKYFRYLHFENLRNFTNDKYNDVTFDVNIPSYGLTSPFNVYTKGLDTYVNGTVSGAMAKSNLLPPFAVIRKIEMYDKLALNNLYNKIRIYIGNRSYGNYYDASVPAGQAKERVTLFEGHIIAFYEDLTKQNIECVWLNNGVVDDTIRAGNIIIYYTPLYDLSGYGISSETTIIQAEQ